MGDLFKAVQLEKEEEDSEEEEKVEKKFELSAIADSELLFSNPMMKGFIRINNLLQVKKKKKKLYYTMKKKNLYYTIKKKKKKLKLK
jgi:hypothetical protein